MSYYSVAKGDRGIVKVDGIEVKATACETGMNGHAVVLRPDKLRITDTACPRVIVRGNVTFDRMKGNQ